MHGVSQAAGACGPPASAAPRRRIAPFYKARAITSRWMSLVPS